MPAKQDSSLLRARLAAAAVATLGAVGALLGWYLFAFDAALLPYAVAVIACATLTTNRMVLWLHRPPTAQICRSALASVQAHPQKTQLASRLFKRCAAYFAGNRFVWHRAPKRWFAHWPIMLGCVIAGAIVVPLIFGWVHFSTNPGNFDVYRIIVFGIPTISMPTNSLAAFMMFHGLVWASFLVLFGCATAAWRRLRDRGDHAIQTPWQDIFPLLVLGSLAATGLVLTVSYTWMGGWGHAALAFLHMLVVIFALVWLPFGKLLHVPQRVAKLAHLTLDAAAEDEEPATCRCCGQAFAPARQIADLKKVTQELGYNYQLTDGHYQDVCPRCRRSLLVTAQGRRWQAARPELSPVDPALVGKEA